MLQTLGRQGRKHSRHAADSRAGRQEDSQDMLQTNRQPGKDTVKLGHHHQGYQRAGKWHMEGLRAVGFCKKKYLVQRYGFGLSLKTPGMSQQASIHLVKQERWNASTLYHLQGIPRPIEEYLVSLSPSSRVIFAGV
jgi:hypothetical protein